ncbi:nicotinamide riboside transporter PnuC [Novosphingobium sp. G106]|uniref:nicotinamide riboside transporter PnuC n=1 Tax=Novosphingobium sp. G106 TaxID=2849500 RepID=UPI002810FC84|nr:nicotinamide riboside transporter PnuC [Novosphingobium sp. G106]
MSKLDFVAAAFDHANLASELEFLAVAFGLANTGLLIRKSVLNFPFGIAMVTLYAAIFFETRLYSEALLQVFFFCVQVFGWWKWQRAIEEEGEVIVEWSSPRVMIRCIALTAILSLLLGWVMATFTNAAAPYPDATVAAASVVAQFLLSYRRIENWIYWIAIDVLSIILYVWRGLNLTAGLYIVLLIMSVIGLGAWLSSRRAIRV